MRLSAILALLFASCAGPPVEWTRIVDNPFEDSNLVTKDYDYVMTRVVDASTGAPIPGATLSFVDEHDYSVKALPHFLRTATADEFGFIRLAVAPVAGDWVYARARGYAPTADQIMMQEYPLELVPGEDIRVRILDPLGRPVAGGTAQYYLGCGHTPNSRESRTDANGFAVLEAIDPEHGFLFPVGAGIGGSDIELGDIPASGGVRIVYGEPGGTVRGRVVDAAGRPVGGVHVGATSWNHGPWTRTDEQGAFLLVGAERFSHLQVHANADDSRILAALTAPPPDVAVTIRTGVAKEETHVVRLLLGEPDVEICAVRHADGRTIVVDSAGTDGEAELSLPAGRWELRIGGEVGPFVHQRMTIDAEEAAKETMRVTVRLWPAVPVDGIDPSLEWHVVVASANEERWISEEEEEIGMVHIPRDADMALRLVSTGESRAGFPGCLVAVPKGASPRGGLRLPAPPDWERLRALPTEGGGTVTVLDVAGAPIEGAWVKARFRNSVTAGYTDENGQCTVGPTGARAVVQADREDGYWATLRTRLEGEGPWTIQFGSASVRIEVRDANGAPIAWSGLLPDGDSVWNREDDLVTHGFDAGIYRVLATADGCRAVVQQFELRNGENRTLRIVLPAR